MCADAVSPRRASILAAAEREFASHGNAGARMDRIAAAAGVNKQLLFHYFGSKAGLREAVSESVAGKLDISIPHGRTPAERLRELVAVLLTAAEEYHSVLSDEWRELASRRAAQILGDGQRQGYFRDDIDPAKLSELIAAASLGWAALPGRNDAAPRIEARKQFGDLVAAVMHDYCAWR